MTTRSLPCSKVIIMSNGCKKCCPNCESKQLKHVNVVPMISSGTTHMECLDCGKVFNEQTEATVEDFIKRAKALDNSAHEHSRSNYAHFRARAFRCRRIARRRITMTKDEIQNDWIPIGADYDMGSWSVLWAKLTKDGWEFRQGSIGLSYIEKGTPGGVSTTEGDHSE